VTDPVAPRGLNSYWRDYRGPLLLLALLFCFRSAWADWVYVPSGSMNPTILEGDRLLVDKHVYGLRVPFSLAHLTQGEDPARGDIVVFDSPRDGTSLVKRVVAIPGDRVALEGERLIVNGVAAAYRPSERGAIESLPEATRLQDPLVLHESGPLPAHDILLLPQRLGRASVGQVAVPDGSYFVLGDNRDNSADSRYIGFVPRRNIVGRATRIVVSLDPDRHFLPRPDRLLRLLD
jgi:signal peptidase I